MQNILKFIRSFLLIIAYSNNMETFLDSALFISEEGRPKAIKWLDPKTHVVTMFKLETAGVEDEKELLDKAINYDPKIIHS